MTASNEPPLYLTTAEAAKILHMSVRTLKRLRLVGAGPRFCKSGRRVVYRRHELDDWLDARSYASTSEARRAGVT
jgi:hypothetical protein